MVDRKCPGCSAAIDADAIFCNVCGLALERAAPLSPAAATEVVTSHDAETAQATSALLPCPGCSSLVSNRIRYCTECSYDIWTSTPAPKAAPEPTVLQTPPQRVEPTPASAAVPALDPGVRTAPVRPATPGVLDTSSDGTPISSQLINAAMNRYKHAYYYTRFLETVGQILKWTGMVIAGLIVAVGLVASGSASRSEFGSAGLAIGGAAILMSVVYGGVIFLVFWLWSVLWRAAGQFLKASLDAAIHSSPFLTDLERAELMSLPLVGPNDRRTPPRSYDSAPSFSYRPERESWFNPNFIADDGAGFLSRTLGGLRTQKASLICYLSPIVAPIVSVILAIVLQALVPGLSVLGYLVAIASPFVLPAMLLRTPPHSRNAAVRFHAFQALMLSGALLGTNLLLIALSQLTGGGISGQAIMVVGLAAWGYFVYLSVKANNGEPVRAPVVGEWAARFSQAI